MKAMVEIFVDMQRYREGVYFYVKLKIDWTYFALQKWKKNVKP